MLSFRRTALTAGLLALTGLLWSATAPHAGAQGKKKGEPKAAGALLSKNEELTDNDEKDTHALLTNSPRKVYKIKLTEGKTYQINLTSKDFDAVLRLEDPAGKEIAFNDDFEPGKSLDARIIQAINKTGEYKIIATCLDGKTGKFSLTVVEAKAGLAAGSMFKGKAIELTLKDGKAKYDGELTNTDPIAQNHYYKLFTIKLEAGKTYRIEHRDAGDDPQFDPFLFLEDANGKKLAQDDDSAGGLNSRIIHKAATTGVYRIICTTLPPRQTGKFTLEVTPGTADDEKEARARELVGSYAKSAPAEQKKIVGELTKYFQAKGENLSVGDANMATELAYQLDEANLELSKHALKSLHKAFSSAGINQATMTAKMLQSTLTHLEMIGSPPAIAGQTVDGKDFDLKKLKGKVVLVDFWATWCGPCIAEIPNIQSAYKKYHGKGFEVIGVSLDRPNDGEKLARFIEDRKLPWRCINIEDSTVLAEKYDVMSIPFAVLVDQAGNVVSVQARGPRLEMLLERLLGGKDK